MQILNIALIGGSGFVGMAVLQEALYRGHSVTAMARRPEKITLRHDSLRTLAVDVMEAAMLVPALAGHDVAISAWKPAWGVPDLHEQFLKGSLFIQHAVKAAAVPRLMITGNAGSLYVAPALQWVDAAEYAAYWRPIPAASRDFLHLLLETSLPNWTYLTPPFDLSASSSGIRTGSYRTGTDGPVYNEQGKSTISVEDFAVAMLDEIETPRYPCQRFTVGY